MGDTLLGLLTGTLVILSLGLMACGFIFKKSSLMIGAGLSFVIFAVVMRNQTTATGWTDWDFYMGLWWLGLALSLLCFFESWLVARKAKVEEEEEEDSLTRRVRTIGERSSKISNLRRGIRGR